MSTVSHQSHRRSGSHSSTRSPPRSPSPPRQTFHPSLIIKPVPTPALLESVAGAAHYSGARPEGDTGKRRRRSSAHQADIGKISADHQRIFEDLKELYCCRPTKQIFERSFAKDVTFEDPLSKCAGINQVMSQFFAMPKFFSKSESLGSRVMSSTTLPNQIIFWQQQEYTLRLLGRKKVIESIIVVDLDEEDKIIRLLDQWDGQDLPSWFGSTLVRSMNGKIMPWLVHVPQM
ncbi:hypothetical protein FA15DRAFT_667530 [Coprinopsis marcescibilis]|uniref:Uncharacterized protein n=1 Tax=Coprinopsis marcescibilis TaxID=230819 RepID=A0A5C3LDF0_COPMA|nr:hypothetical protein FA15DRAFT_667530 [Coprinopsis marcescibilis]